MNNLYKRIYKNICTVIVSVINLSNIYCQGYIDADQFQAKDTNVRNIYYSRNQIITFIKQHELSKVKDMVMALDFNYYNTEYLTFYPIERWLLSYWIEDYNTILNGARNFTIVSGQNKFEVYPAIDVFSDNIRKISIQNQDTLLKILSKSSLSNEEREFLTLVLHYLFFDEESEFISQDYLNNESDRFLENYPTSEYNEFVRQKIRFRLNETPFVFGTCFYTGYAVNMGSIGSYFSNTAPIVLSFDIEYNRFFSSFQFQLGVASEIKQTFNYGGTWTKKMKVNYYQPGILLGYNIFSIGKFNIHSFLSPSVRGFLPTRLEVDLHNEYKNLSIGPSFTYNFGFNVDYSLIKDTDYSYGKKVDTGWYVRFQTGFSYPTFFNSDEIFRGSVIYFIIGISTNRNISKREF